MTENPSPAPNSSPEELPKQDSRYGDIAEESKAKKPIPGYLMGNRPWLIIGGMVAIPAVALSLLSMRGGDSDRDSATPSGITPVESLFTGPSKPDIFTNIDPDKLTTPVRNLSFESMTVSTRCKMVGRVAGTSVMSNSLVLRRVDENAPTRLKKTELTEKQIDALAVAQQYKYEKRFEVPVLDEDTKEERALELQRVRDNLAGIECASVNGVAISSQNKITDRTVYANEQGFDARADAIEAARCDSIFEKPGCAVGGVWDKRGWVVFGEIALVVMLFVESTRNFAYGAFKLQGKLISGAVKGIGKILGQTVDTAGRRRESRPTRSRIIGTDSEEALEVIHVVGPDGTIEPATSADTRDEFYNPEWDARKKGP